VIDSGLEPLAMEWVIAMRKGHAVVNDGLVHLLPNRSLWSTRNCQAKSG